MRINDHVLIICIIVFPWLDAKIDQIKVTQSVSFSPIKQIQCNIDVGETAKQTNSVCGGLNWEKPMGITLMLALYWSI